MKNIIGVLAFLCFITMLFNCKKQDEEKDLGGGNNSIVAGEKASHFTVLNDTIINFQGTPGYFALDLNDDQTIDLELESFHTWMQGGMFNQYWSTLKVNSNTEVLADTTIKESTAYIVKQYRQKNITVNDTVTYYKQDTIPAILYQGHVVDKKGLWLTDMKFKLCSQSSGLFFYSDTLISSGSYQFKGWSDLDNKYLGFRLIGAEDTVYGWLNVTVIDYDQIILKEFSYSK